MTQHYPYSSIEQFRISDKDEYKKIYKEVIVFEKIHGSNICIVGIFNNQEWDFKLGTRKRWLQKHEVFNNFQTLFEENKDKISDLFNQIKGESEEIVIRLYGEIFGGKYGSKRDKISNRTQKEPNYCPFNDFAFFDIMINGKFINILKTIDYLKKFEIKLVPIIFQGLFSDFIDSFDVNTFNSVLSKEFYNLDFISSPKATEGVIIRTTNSIPEEKESIVLKWKQDWALENGRIKNKKKNVNTLTEIEQECLNMLNDNRISSYASKITNQELKDLKNIKTHIREIIDDTYKDIILEFPELKTIEKEEEFKNIKKKLNQKAFLTYKKYITNI